MIPPKVRLEMKQLPDWLRRALGLGERFRKGHTLQIPHEVEAALNEVLERMLSGVTRDLQSSANIKVPVLVKTAQQIFDRWKAACQQVSEDPSMLNKIPTCFFLTFGYVP